MTDNYEWMKTNEPSRDDYSPYTDGNILAT